MPFVGNIIETALSDFGRLIRDNRVFVDKSGLIGQFIDGSAVSLMTRPRRSVILILKMTFIFKIK